MKFRQIEIDDYEKVSQLLKQSGIENCEHCFATMLVWSKRHDVMIAVEENTVFMRSFGKEHIWYLYPRGDMEPEKAIEKILCDADGKKVSIYGVDEKNARFLQEYYGDVFDVREDRDSSDYLYRSSDLATLPGKNYQKKRNHVSRFIRENPDYKFIVISQQNIHMAKQFLSEWNLQYNAENSWDLYSEQQGIHRLLDNFEKLELIGAMIETGGRIVAMSIAAPVNDTMVDVLVEKAYHDVNGAYAIINRDFAVNCLTQFELINREDDMGIENLRKAKMSYFPVEIRKKYLAQSR
ncbi:MAG: DUF2156 domain-containing protein [Oscillospiraceae bacterium]|nr:DUF2156 domain-containing protein [Oscillospiraceae bacterium]